MTAHETGSIRLSFGTAGIRARLGPALDELNVYTVSGVAHAICDYLRTQQPGATGRGLCVGFDGRTDSDVFAREVVTIARACGFLVRAFEAPVATPLVAFCTRFYGAAAGIMITASHNPPADNGIKLYLEGGAQVLAPHDAAIAARIAAYQPREAPLTDQSCGAYQRMGELEVDAYLDTITTLVPPSSLPTPRFGYSAMCGVGTLITRRLLARIGATQVCEVSAQAEPQADFGGLSSPNPEHGSALAQLLALCDAEQLPLAFAHDPDADRLAVIVRDHDGIARPLSGDEVGALLGDFLLSEQREPQRALLLSTLVSGELLERICQSYGARFERTPTGFKWIAARARALERSDGVSFLFGYEEAIGYAFGRIADDKDGIAAMGVLLELTRRLQARGHTLRDRLDALSRQHGLFVTRQLTVPRAATEPGGTDLMTKLRAIEPSTLLGPGSTRIDYQTQPEQVELLVFRRPNGDRLCVRPSGTEPKLKLYLHASVPATADLEAARTQATHHLDDLEQRTRSLP